MPCQNCGSACQGKYCADCQRSEGQEERYGTPAENIQHRKRHDPVKPRVCRKEPDCTGAVERKQTSFETSDENPTIHLYECEFGHQFTVQASTEAVTQ